MTPERVLHIDSKVLAEAEAKEEVDSRERIGDSEQWIDGSEGEEESEPLTTIHRPLTAAQKAELLRQMVDTVGKVGQPGEITDILMKCVGSGGCG